MRHVPLASPASPRATRGSRHWRRMRARLGLMALWAALLVWSLGASLQVPGEAGAGEARAAPSPEAAVQVGPPLPHVDLERAAAWPQESAESWQAPSHESARDTALEPSPEEEAALYIAGR